MRIAFLLLGIFAMSAELAGPAAGDAGAAGDRHVSRREGRRSVSLAGDGQDPEVKAWSDAENAYARQFLDRLPNVAAIRARVTEIMSAKSPSYGERDVSRRAVLCHQDAAAQAAADADRARLARRSVERAGGASIRTRSIRRAARRSIGTSRRRTGSWWRCRSRVGGSEAGDVHIYSTDDGQGRSMRSCRT